MILKQAQSKLSAQEKESLLVEQINKISEEFNMD